MVKWQNNFISGQQFQKAKWQPWSDSDFAMSCITAITLSCERFFGHLLGHFFCLILISMDDKVCTFTFRGLKNMTKKGSKQNTISFFRLFFKSLSQGNKRRKKFEYKLAFGVSSQNPLFSSKRNSNGLPIKHSMLTQLFNKVFDRPFYRKL